MLPEFSADVIVLSGLALVFAGIIRGIVGFGLLLVATPLLILLHPPKLAIAALIVPTIPTDITILYRDGIPFSVIRERWSVFSIAVLGTATGVLGLVVLSPALLSLIVAMYIAGYLLFSRYESVVHGYAKGRDMGLASGALSGLLGGSTGLAGPPIVAYLHAQDLERATFTSTLALFFTTIAVVRIPTMVATDLFGPTELALGIGLVIPAVVGTYAGTAIRPHLPKRLFERFVDVLLLVVAVQLARDGLGVSLL